jgi:hypothetical protein
MRRVWIALGVIVFVGISIELARWLTVENRERTDILSLLTAEARGDERAMLAALHACSPACRRDVRADARRLRMRGRVLLLADSSSTAYSVTGRTGLTRVAWKAGSHLPVVQCVTVQRTGNAITGIGVRLLRVSQPIPPTSDC